MLSYLVVSEIENLLHEGLLSRRSIARRLGVSRGAVDAIASGRRAQTRVQDGQDSSSPTYLRCPGCGMRVELPCVYCRAVAYVDRRRQGCVGGDRRRAA